LIKNVFAPECPELPSGIVKDKDPDILLLADSHTDEKSWSTDL
jgi:hypothetical protein